MYDIGNLIGLDKGELAVVEEQLSINNFYDFSNALSFLNIGTILKFKLSDGSDTEVMVADIKDDIATMVHVGFVGKIRRMNPDNSTFGGYKSSELRVILNTEIIELYPTWIIAKMIPDTLGDLLRLLSNEEVFGEDVHGVPYPDNQLEVMKYLRNRVAFNKDTHIAWWLSTVVSYSAFGVVNSIGNASYSVASSLFGVRPLFKMSLI